MPTFATGGSSSLLRGVAPSATTPAAGSPAWVVHWRKARKAGGNGGTDHYVATRIVAPTFGGNPGGAVGRATDPNIPAAITALAGAPGVIYLLEGVFTITAQIVLAEGQVLIGAGGKGATSKIQTAIPDPLPGGAAIVAFKGNGFQNIAFAYDSGPGFAVMIHLPTEQNWVKDCRFGPNSSDIWVRVPGGSNGENGALIEGCTFNHAGGGSAAIKAVNGANNLDVRDCTFLGEVFGVLIDPDPGFAVTNVVVSGCTWEGVANSQALVRAETGDIRDLRITDNFIRGGNTESPFDHRIVLDASEEGSAISGVVVVGNTFRDTGGVLALFVSELTVGNNTFTGAGFSAFALRAGDCSGVAFTGNVVETPAGVPLGDLWNGVNVFGSLEPSGPTQIIGNTFRRSGGVVASNIVWLTVSGNTFVTGASGIGGILVTVGTLVTIEGNVLDDTPGVAAINVGSANSVTIGGNAVRGSAGDGIRIDGDRIAVNCNISCGNGGTDINFAGGDGDTQTYVGNVRLSELGPPVASAANATCTIAP